jgi:hypothetical protein
VEEGILLVICLTVVIVVGVNGALLAALRRGNEAGQINLLRKATHRACDPWGSEDAGLKELSQRVAALRSSQRPEEPADAEE